MVIHGKAFFHWPDFHFLMKLHVYDEYNDPKACDFEFFVSEILKFLEKLKVTNIQTDYTSEILFQKHSQGCGKCRWRTRANIYRAP